MESRESIYLDILRLDTKLDTFELIVKTDLSEASLQLINTSKLTPQTFKNCILFQALTGFARIAFSPSGALVMNAEYILD